MSEPRYDPASPMRQPAFWRGALRVHDGWFSEYYEPSREALLRRGLVERIADGVGKGRPLRTIPEYRIWLAQGARSLEVVL